MEKFWEKRGDTDQRVWQWLKAGELKQQTDSHKCAAQEQALQKNSVKSDMINVQPICRICKEKVESVTHIGISCSVTAGNQFRKRYGKLKEKVHWLLC